MTRADFRAICIGRYEQGGTAKQTYDVALSSMKIHGSISFYRSLQFISSDFVFLLSFCFQKENNIKASI